VSHLYSAKSRSQVLLNGESIVQRNLRDHADRYNRKGKTCARHLSLLSSRIALSKVTLPLPTALSNVRVDARVSVLVDCEMRTEISDQNEMKDQFENSRTITKPSSGTRGLGTCLADATHAPKTAPFPRFARRPLKAGR